MERGAGTMMRSVVHPSIQLAADAGKPRRGWLSSWWVVGLGLGWTGLAGADIYLFTDAAGGVHLSDFPLDERSTLLLKDPSPPPLAATPAPVVKAAAKPAGRYHDLVNAAASAQRIDKALVHAVIKAESNYNPDAVSHKGAAGLMQLMPDTARRYGVGDVHDPEQNILGGTRYLKDLLQRFNADMRLALAAYNAGENAVSRYGNSIPPYPETQGYVRKVLSLYDRYRAVLP